MNSVEFTPLMRGLLRIRSTKRDKNGKAPQLQDVVLLLMLADGKPHQRSEIDRVLTAYGVSTNQLSESIQRLVRVFDLVDRREDPDNFVKSIIGLNVKGRQLVADFMRDLEDYYASATFTGKVASRH